MTVDLAIYTMLFIAAITPGPNNLIVLRAAIAGGVPAALPVVAAVVLGGLALLAMASAGVGSLLAGHPDVVRACAIAGGGYLAYLGLAGLCRAGAPAAAAAGPRGFLAVLGFQLVNPKAWVMLVTATTASRGSTVMLAFAFTMISSVCLVAWAAAGAGLGRALARPRIAVWADRVMGALLIGAGGALIGAA